MSELQTNLQEILQEKQEKIIPENIKKDVQIFDIIGTYTGENPTGEGVKLFETVEEMQADPTAKEGDMAIVYGDQMQNITVNTKTQYINFPNTVVLPDAFTDFAAANLSSVDESFIFNGGIILDPNSFTVRVMSQDGNFNISYTSEDGITYTRTDSIGNPVDMKTIVEFINPEEWNDSFAYFMQSQIKCFEGLYEYTLNYTDETKRLFPAMANVVVDFDSNIGTYDYDKSQIYIDNEKLIQIANKIADENNITDTSYAIFLDTNNKIHMVDIRNAFAMYSVDESQQYPSINSSSTESEKVYTDYVISETLDSYSSVQKTFSKATYGPNNYYYCSDLLLKTYPGRMKLNKTSNGGSAWFSDHWTKDSFSISPFKLSSATTVGKNISGTEYDVVWLITDMYILAKNQYTLESSEQLLNGISAYGKNGNVVGTASIGSGIDTSDADATENDIALGKTAYVNNEKITGTIESIENNREVSAGALVANDEEQTIRGQFAFSSRRLLESGYFIRPTMSYSDIVDVLKITSDQIVEGNTILGVKGTASAGGSASGILINIETGAMCNTNVGSMILPGELTSTGNVNGVDYTAAINMYGYDPGSNAIMVEVIVDFAETTRDVFVYGKLVFGDDGSEIESERITIDNLTITQLYNHVTLSFTNINIEDVINRSAQINILVENNVN